MASPDGLLYGCAIVAGVVFGVPALVVAAVLMIGIRLVLPGQAIWRLVAIFACVGVGSIRHIDTDFEFSGMDLTTTDRARGVVDSLPIARKAGDRAIIRVDQVRLDGAWTSTDIRVLAYLPDDREVTIGDEIEVVWSFSPVSSMAPGFGSFVSSQDAAGSASIWSVQLTRSSNSLRRFLVDLRHNVSAQIQKQVTGDPGALMSGIVTGDDSALSDEVRTAFFRTGTGHITAVSGSNIAMLLALWSRSFRSRTRRHHLLVQAGIVLSIWTYCAATGLEASALRATTVATLVVLSGRFGRRADPLTILALASAGLLLFQPSLTGSVGFWLSVSASGAIAGTFASSQDGSKRSDLVSGFYGLVAAQFATLPIVVWAFGTLSVTGLLANILISPVMVLAFPTTFVYAAVAFVPVIGELTSFIPGLLSDLTLNIVQRLAPIIDPLYLDAGGKSAAILIALPCALVVLSLNRDVQRWLPRLKSSADAHPSVTISGVGGATLGFILAVTIWTLWL